MKIDVINTSGEKVKTIELPSELFNVELSEHVVHNVVKAYRANRRQGTHATKTRSLVSGGGKKPFKQKGTGNARQGSSRAPNMPGGAVVHGPQPRSYHQKINGQTKKLAVRMVLSDKFRHGKLFVIDDLALTEFKTKNVAQMLVKLNAPSALISDERKDDFLYFSVRNLKTAGSKAPSELNAEDLLRYESFVVSENGLNALKQRFGV